MGIKWTARLRVDFEMEDGASESLAQARLRTSISRFQEYIETGKPAREVLSSTARPGLRLWRKDRQLSARRRFPAPWTVEDHQKPNDPGGRVRCLGRN